MNRLTKITTSDDWDEYDAYVTDDNHVYMDMGQLIEFFAPYDVIEQWHDYPVAIIAEDIICLESSPLWINGEFITVFDMSYFDLMECVS